MNENQLNEENNIPVHCFSYDKSHKTQFFLMHWNETSNARLVFHSEDNHLMQIE